MWTTGKAWAAGIATVVLISGAAVGIPIAVDAINANTAPVVSALQEKSQVYTAQNRINQYTKFYSEYTTYQADMTSVYDSIKTLDAFNKEYTAAQISSDPTGDLEQIQGQDQESVTGAQTLCATAADTFNNDSKEVQTGAQFKGVDLSKQVSVSACQTGSLTGN